MPCLRLGVPPGPSGAGFSICQMATSTGPSMQRERRGIPRFRPSPRHVVRRVPGLADQLPHSDPRKITRRGAVDGL